VIEIERARSAHVSLKRQEPIQRPLRADAAASRGDVWFVTYVDPALRFNRGKPAVMGAASRRALRAVI
jgi:hypothetical protein